MGLTWKITIHHLDGCIIFLKTVEQHLERLRQVFGRFRSANIKINPVNCEFLRKRVPFLGHIISKNCLKADLEKAAAVNKFPIPTGLTEIKSFLGLCAHHPSYVKNLIDMTRPLHNANESKSLFLWTPDAQDCF